MFGRRMIANTLVVSFLCGVVKAGPDAFLWYDFDEAGPNTVAHDSSGNEYHGLIDTDLAEPNWDPADGFFDGCLVFNNDTAVIVPNDVLTEVNDAITIQIRVTDAFGHDGNNWLFDTGAGDYRMQAAIMTEPHLKIFWRAGNDTNDVLIWDLSDVDPNLLEYGPPPHFIKDEAAGTMTIGWEWLDPWGGRSYFVTKSGVDKTLSEVKNSPFKIGALTEHDHDLTGRIYYFGMYDYAFHFSCPPDRGRAWGPQPYDGEANVPPDANLTWIAGDYAVQHEVFFGTAWEDVNGMTDPCATKNLGDELYEPPDLLDFDTTYYWRVDEVNGPNTWKGQIWSFATAKYIVIEDFERYDDHDSRIYYTWCDQRCQMFEETGSWLTLVMYPDHVHSGSQAVEYLYDIDDPYAVYDYAEAWLPLDETDGFQDWRIADLRLLGLFFYGDADNDANETEQMYVGVTDTEGLYGEVRYGDHPGEYLGDLKVPEWQSWLIPLTWFTDGNSAAPNDINFASVASVHVGFGDRRNPVPGGTGYVCFDDIRLYPRMCVALPWLPDLNCDCRVNYEDLRMMVLNWLKVGDLPGQLVGNDEINLKDFAKLAEYWLEDHHWPPK